MGVIKKYPQAPGGLSKITLGALGGIENYPWAPGVIKNYPRALGVITNYRQGPKTVFKYRFFSSRSQ